ncbi:hypothetical protein KFK09_027353 [Dendrobium nobile]|uniref:Uncharacterized protein n=1 Tax=Dendrobium nobile TaxID=94219 RepID=A0A8T3A9G4_DENNO|nr:hypothetical protein KFK09_027353 [Dendrobium nobile]
MKRSASDWDLDELLSELIKLVELPPSHGATEGDGNQHSPLATSEGLLTCWMTQKIIGDVGDSGDDDGNTTEVFDFNNRVSNRVSVIRNQKEMDYFRRYL